MGPDAIRLFEGFVAAAGHFLPGVALTLWESSDTGVRLLAGTADPVLRERLKATPADPDLLLLPLGPFFLTAVLDRALTPREREGLTRLATQTITHATLLDQVLRAKREWEQTVDTIHDPLTIVSPDLRVVRANAAAAALTGESPKAIVGRPCFSALRGRAEPCPGCPLQMPPPSHEPTFLEFSPVFDRRTHHAFLYPVFDDAGRLTAMIEHIRDVSGQRELVETMVRAQKAGALVTMVAGIAHNFNNLLDIILGQAQLRGTGAPGSGAPDPGVSGPGANVAGRSGRPGGGPRHLPADPAGPGESGGAEGGDHQPPLQRPGRHAGRRDPHRDHPRGGGRRRGQHCGHRRRDDRRSPAADV